MTLMLKLLPLLLLFMEMVIDPPAAPAAATNKNPDVVYLRHGPGRKHRSQYSSCVVMRGYHDQSKHLTVGHRD